MLRNLAGRRAMLLSLKFSFQISSSEKLVGQRQGSSGALVKASRMLIEG
jgi:hypothetical protein